MSLKNRMKNITLERTEETKENTFSIIPDMKLEGIKADFKHNINRIRSKFIIVNELNSKGLDDAANDILRSQVVLLMSTVDFYIHEVVKYGVLKIFSKEKPRTDEYEKILLGIECVEKALENPECIDWLEEGIIAQHKYKSFMGSNKIRSALKIVSNEKVFDIALKSVSEDIGKTKKEVEDIIRDLSDRRNCIVHQTDRNPVNCEINEILKEDVTLGIDVVEKIILNIHKSIMNEV